MKLKIFTILLLIFTTFFTTFAEADPNVSFTATSVENKTVLRPNINSDVTHYKWSIIGKGDAYNLETGWIPYVDRSDHISMLESGTYFVTITGRNANTGLSDEFTNEVKVSVKEDYVKPSEEEKKGDIGSLIINSLPEPLKTFFSERNEVELGVIVLGSILLLAIATRRKKTKKYIQLEAHHEK